MASKKQTGSFDFRNTLLVIYIGIGVLMVIATLGMAFLESNVVAAEPTPTTRPTLSPVVLTMQAEDYEEHEHQGQGRGAGNGINSNEHEQQTPETTPEPDVTPQS